MRKALISLLVLPLAISGCQTTDVSSTNPLLVKSGSFSTLGLATVDFEFAAKSAVDEFLQSPYAVSPDKRKKVVVMGDVLNDTTVTVSTALITNKMKVMMQRSNKFIFSAATGRESTSTVRDYRDLDRSKLYDQGTGGRGKIIKPDYEMLGVIRQATAISTDRRKQEIGYEFYFRVVDLASGLELFQALVPITKVGSNQNFTW